MAESSDVSSSWGDRAAGAALGLLLGVLSGLSASPIVSIVVSALVALIAGVVGLTPETRLRLSSSGARRLTAFALAAALTTPAAIWARTHDLLAPSLERRAAALSAMGYEEGTAEFRDTLRYLQFGLAPAGTTVAKPPPGGQGVLYASPSRGFCDDLSRMESLEDVLTLFERSEAPLPRAAGRIRKLAPERRGTPEALKLLACPEL